MRTDCSRRPADRGWLLTAVLVVAGCSALHRIDVPSTLPNTHREQFLTLRWTLVRGDGTVRAVGLAESSGGSHWDATVALEGVDGQGLVVSRSSSAIRPGFSPGSTPFEVALVPKGVEAEFQLRIPWAQQYTRPGR